MGDPWQEETEETEEEKPAKPPSTPYQHAGLTERLLMDLVDTMNRRRAEAAVKGSKKRPKKVKEYPRPISAKERIMEARSNEEIDSLAEELGYLEED